VLPAGFSLPRELEIAIENRWVIRPVLAESIFASPEAYVGVPSNQRAQIEFWAATNEGCSWALTTGPGSGVIAAEIDTHSGSEPLRELSSDDWTTLKQTLGFDAGHSWFALFAFAENLRKVREHSPWLRIHAGDQILIPPSVRSGERLFFRETSMRLADAPDWLRAPSATGESQPLLTRIA
jgi:hypothetical protein